MTAIHNEPFVPLTPAAPAKDAREFRATIVSRPAAAQPLRPPATSAAPSHPKTASGSGCEPRVSVQREDDHVSGIRIECACGQVIDLACVYQETPKSS